VRLVRIATALYLILALPGLIFGFLLKVAPLGLPCDSSGGLWSLDTWRPVTSGEPCRTIDYATLYWLVPAVTLLIIGAAIALARHPATFSPPEGV
jgi:hypothetical protein